MDGCEGYCGRREREEGGDGGWCGCGRPMGAKKKESSGAGKKGGAGAVDLSTLSLTPRRLSDASPLLFDGSGGELPFALPFVGPIALVERGGGAANGETSAVVHGRGLVATRDVKAGECLFVTPAIVSADAAEVRLRYLQQQQQGKDAARDLEQMTEDNLVEQVQSLCQIVKDAEIQPKETVDRARRLLAAFSAQMSSEDVPTVDAPDEWMDILLGEPSSMGTANDGDESGKLNRDTIVNTIRRNAFGPDFHGYDAITKCWTGRENTENCYNRLLAAYPLAASINHSCTPSAVRVFGRIPTSSGGNTSEIDAVRGREVMIVHACAAIRKGTEITWSYLPACTPYAVRREMLSSKYGFKCKCVRCEKEEGASDIPELKEVSDVADGMWSLRDQRRDAELTDLVSSLEDCFASAKHSPNETQRYIRVGYAALYMEHFNVSLGNGSDVSELLELATLLHFSFASCNNASTEHLGVLHLCYELSGVLHTRAMNGMGLGLIMSGLDAGDPTKTLNGVRFWTEQLKKAHMTRYGELGEDVSKVRELMKHSKLVLRNRDGFYLARHKFI
ncbi:hypothetical protein ACHAXT_002945 [Thalassiosira profunda]